LASTHGVAADDEATDAEGMHGVATHGVATHGVAADDEAISGCLRRTGCSGHLGQTVWTSTAASSTFKTIAVTATPAMKHKM
jgi:hypothetical protein